MSHLSYFSLVYESKIQNLLLKKKKRKNRIFIDHNLMNTYTKDLHNLVLLLRVFALESICVSIVFRKLIQLG